MALDIQWDHQFCLACDKQTDGATYCSESCRLADYEKTSSAASSGASSPALPGPHHAWGFSSTTTTSSSHASGLYLSPALDFLSQSSSARSSTRQQPSASFSTRPLSPSSSHSSLSSMGSSNAVRTSNEAHQLSEKARRELHAYASTFEQVRLQRRRSY